MRLKVLAAVLFAVCGAMPQSAQALPLSSGASHVAAPRQNARAKLQRPGQTASSQLFIDATHVGSPLLLDKGWRVGVTSNPAAASAGFDDSAWSTRDAKAVIEDVSEKDEENAGPDAASGNPSSASSPPHAASHRRYVWFRLHIQLAPNHAPLALLVELPISHSTAVSVGSEQASAEVFANGKPIQPEGPHGATPQHYQQISRIYDLQAPPSETSLVLAVRTIYVPFGYSAYTGFFASRSFYLGNRGDLERRLDLWSDRTLFERIPRLVYSALLVVLAVFLFALYFAQKGHTEYLWLALHELAGAPIGFIEFAGSTARLDSIWYVALVLQLIAVSAYLFFEFLVAFLALKRRWYIAWLRYTASVLLLIAPTLLLVGLSDVVGVLLAAVFLFGLLWMLGWSLFVFITLIAASLKRNFEAGLLLIPLILNVVGLVEPVAASVVTDDAGRTYNSPLTFQAGPIPIHFTAIADFAGILAIVLIIFFRFLRIHRERERVSSELEAARSVQELLIPREKPSTPGFEVESVYNPASEVGGDFFHVQTVGFDGMLVVIGDVAGKGLKAAMNVSLLIGALRRIEQRSPAAILATLNGVLSGAESLTTCQAIWFGANGEMVVANAGHLPPYLNSQEIALPGNLPLGVLANIQYEESRFYLHPGDRVLLLSDGVVEARQPSGELFGFDRLRRFSQQSAFYIAEAARAFGQQDDITVLTIRREVEALAA